jgi:hypothetical protein
MAWGYVRLERELKRKKKPQVALYLLKELSNNGQ